jgi:hypothetical protein
MNSPYKHFLCNTQHFCIAHSDTWFNNVTPHVHCPYCYEAGFRLLQGDVRKRARTDTLYVRTFHSPSHLMWEILPCHKTEALHVTHILSNSPMEPAVLFLCSLSTKSHATCLRCRSSHSAAVPPTPASRFK